MATNIINGDRNNALSSSWIKRLVPNPHPPTSIPVIIPFHLMGPKNPQLPLPSPTLKEGEDEVVGSSFSSETITGFGPFQVRNARGTNLIDGSCSKMECEQEERVGRRKGSASHGGDEDRPAAGRNLYVDDAPSDDDEPPVLTLNQLQILYQVQLLNLLISMCLLLCGKNPHAFTGGTAHLCEREAEEPFSYWNMGRASPRENFVSSVYPPSSSVMIPSRKRTADTCSFISSKFGKFCDED